MTTSAIVCEVDYASYEKKPRILPLNPGCLMLGSLFHGL